MRIALIAPSPVPFVLGGAEHLTLGLQRYINEETPFACELIKVPTRENSLANLIKSYETFWNLDLSSYDVVVSTKYPSWMVRHPMHIVYMIHPLRGLYDTYHFARKPLEVLGGSDAVKSLQRIMSASAQNDFVDVGQLEHFFDVANRAIDSDAIEPEHMAFPGPFARQIIHYLDKFAMTPARISRYAAISATVSKRKDYFPSGVNVSVLNPPPRIREFRTGGDDHLFTLSRLDGPKRLALLIRAMRKVKANIPLLIGGTGPLAEELKREADGDARISFLGAMTDAEVINHYADSLAVPFIPYEEDYGLITIEAMRSKKAVLTAKDSGDVNEFVIHGETGLSVEADETAIARAIDFICDNRSLTRQMGEKASRRVEGISWPAVVEGIFNFKLPRRGKRLTRGGRDSPRPRLVVAVTFPIFPPRGGGQTRVFHLYRGLSKYFDITIVSLGDVQSTQRITEIADNLKEICVPKSAAHQAFENGYSESVNWTPVTDIVASLGIELTPQYVEALKLAAEGVDAIVACHPYLARLLKSVRPEAPLWFEAQDVEVELKRELLPACDRAEELLSTVRNEERFAWQSAELVYGCTASDVAALREHYGPTAARITVVPNGYDSNDIVYADGDKRRETKKIIGLGTAPVVLFMGSWHGPNLDAAKLVIDYASVISAAIFLVVGSAGLKFKGAPVSDNVKLLGVVGDAEKRIILSAADLAINPMLGGSGSNLKMFDYLASGTPVLSTSFGARGIEVKDKTHFLCCDIDDFVFEISKFLVEQKNHSTMTMRAAELVRQHYSWDAIVENFRSALVEFGILPAQIHKSSSLENIECNHLALAP